MENQKLIINEKARFKKSTPQPPLDETIDNNRNLNFTPNKNPTIFESEMSLKNETQAMFVKSQDVTDYRLSDREKYNNRMKTTIDEPAMAF